MQIYNKAKADKDIIKPFFLSDNPDEILANIKIENYIEKMKESTFYGGIIEMSIFINLYNINICVYKLEDINDNYYTHMTNIWKDESINKFMLIHYENNNHFNLLKIKNPKNDNSNIIHSIENNNKFDVKVFSNNILKNKNIEGNFFTNKYVKVNGQYSYYEDIFNYLYSFKINTDNNNKTKWKNVLYPKLYDNDEIKSLKDKKRQNFRIKCNS